MLTVAKQRPLKRAAARAPDREGPMEPHRGRRGKSYFTRVEVARLFEVAPNTINRWVLAGRLPNVMSPGGRCRYPVEAILRLARDLTEAAVAPTLASSAGAKRAPRGKSNVRRAGTPIGRATAR